ncbi:5-formyltetrahydrofolate cyclo-ligase [Robiginitalea sp. SC105]|uniref:5-formyltetrahydrofolate cyclo-ligase n=1 Tax=Robiginitalea sp. SC105 TaxID=2762332 RepID=UPI00163A6039|nr:5-formyltetrahydrofolate cyclo-ligase [Robiginitalea sp. SC105]MBC2838011.1 5-formyltetrahydrofolate cyclo-ligase [Robiginitalea sp. SC105]
MLKNELRLNFLQLRQNLSESTYQKASRQIAERSLKLPIWELQRFHIFLPIPSKKEIDTSPIRRELRSRGKDIVVPRVSGPGQLKHFLITPDTRFENNKWGIPEPVDGEEVAAQTLDVVFLPLLAFDEDGFRVGYGGGYYDRFLAACREDVITVGLSFFGPAGHITDLHGGDLRMHYAVTPGRTYEF